MRRRKQTAIARVAGNLRNHVVVPQEVVDVIIDSGIKPKSVTHFPVSHPVHEHVGLQKVILAGHISQEFEVKFVVLVAV